VSATNFNKKKKIVNIQVKPDSHREINKHLMAQQIAQHPSTTKDQSKDKPFIKLNVKQTAKIP
jgi:hypothetical protein